MSIQCPSSIVFTPEGGAAVTLCPVGGWLATPPKWSADQALYEKPGVLASNAYFNPNGGVALTMDFTVEADFPTHAEAFVVFAAPEMYGTVNLLACAGVLVITSGTQTASYASAAIANIAPALPAGPTATLARTFTIRTCLPSFAA